MKTLPFTQGILLFAALLFSAAAADAAKNPDESASLPRHSRGLLPSAARMTPARTETRRVYTNDDLRPASFPAGEPTVSPAAAQPAEEEPPQVALTRIRHRAEEVLEQGLETLGFRERQLDVLERDFVLSRTQFYSDPNFAIRERGRDYGGLDALGRQIEQQRATLAALQSSLFVVADLVEDLRLEDAAKIAREETARKQTSEYWQAQLAPLQVKLAAVEAERANFRYQTETGRTGIVLGMGNSFLNTHDHINQLEQRKESLRQAIAAIEDQALRENIPPGWLR